jgi:CHAT domain-containing protein
VRTRVTAAFAFLLCACTMALAQQSPKANRYVPPELQATDFAVKNDLDSADGLSAQGNYGQVEQTLQKALARCIEKGLIADRAIVEARLAVLYFSKGQLDQARDHFQNSFSDAVSTSNLALQADTLVALASFSQAIGKTTEAVATLTKALDVSRKSKNLFIQSRVLGELGQMQLALGHKTEARASIDEALRIDRINKYDWEAGHLLYSAWVLSAGPDANWPEAEKQVIAARELSIQKENYLVFIQATVSLAQIFVRTANSDDAIALLQHSRDGISESGQQLFKNIVAFRATVALSYFNIIFLESLAQAYEEGRRSGDALNTWTDLYETAKSANFTLMMAEAAHKLADLYKATNEIDRSTFFYATAADAWAAGGNQQREIAALTSEAFLLTQQGQGGKALEINEKVLPLTKSAHNIVLEFLVNLSIAEITQAKGDLDRTEESLRDAESLLSPDLTINNLEPKYVCELYLRIFNLSEKKGDSFQALLALEKAMLPAGAVGDLKIMATLEQEVKERLGKLDAKRRADLAYETSDFANALTYYELVEHFERTDAAWNGKLDEYTHTENNPVVARLFSLPFALIAKPGGAQLLEANLEQMGPVGAMARLPILTALTNYYVIAQQPDKVARFASAALPYLSLGERDQPNTWDVQIVCELAYSLMLKHSIDSAVQELEPCLRTAKQLGNPQYLALAHQINVWVLQAAGRQVEAQESEQFLLQHSPEDPTHYAELGQLKAQQGEFVESISAWRKALELYETTKEFKSAASSHLALAGALVLNKDLSNEIRFHLQRALEIYKELDDAEGQITAGKFLGEYYGKKKDPTTADKYLKSALALSRQTRRLDLEAGVLSQYGAVFQSANKLKDALDYYTQAARIYHTIGDRSNEAFQLRNEAAVFDAMHNSENALEAALQAKQIADASNSWLPKYWSRRMLAVLYGEQGKFENVLTCLREARDISKAENQVLNSAWASLALTYGLIVVGDWEQALETIDTALPVFEQYQDRDDLLSAYTVLMEIYGARESELRDLDKALSFYQSASKLFGSDPDRAATLSASVVEIYWQMGRFEEAIQQIHAVLPYYERTRNDVGAANALISLAEVQRSAGNIATAKETLAKAGPLVTRTTDFYTSGRLLYGQAGLLRKEGRFPESIKQYENVIELLEQFKATSDVETQRKLSETYTFIYDELIDTYYSQASADKTLKEFSADKALEYAELNKARLFANSWGRSFIDVLRTSIPAQLQERERAIIARERDFQAELQHGMNHASVKDVQRQLQEIRQEETYLQQQLRRDSPAYAEVVYPTHVRLANIPLRSGELVVEFKMVVDGVLVWLITPTEQGNTVAAFYKSKHPKSWFFGRVSQIRDAFNTSHPERFNAVVSEELFNALFPTAAVERVKAAKRIIFIPDNILFLIPFELLSPTASHGDFLFLKTPTEYFPSMASLKLSRAIFRKANTQEWQKEFIGIADPITSPDDERYPAAAILSDLPKLDLANPVVPAASPVSKDKLQSRGISFERLPNTSIEVNSIASLFSSPAEIDLRTGIHASKRDLLQTDLARFRFVHFATHGILPVEAAIKDPALVLSYESNNKDAMFLTSSEVLQMKLHAEMVVLSACNTGSGKVTRAEGVASLGTAFLLSGSSSVTVSLWKVADSSTSLLMHEFYKDVLQGLPKAEALAAARSFLFSKGYDNPFFWAPFIVTGE